MKKSILITGGPTNEIIDEIMKITNMSTGRLSTSLGNIFADQGYDVTLVLNNMVKPGELADRENVSIVFVETADEMLKAIENLKTKNFDALIHASAVGDYKCDFTFLMEDMAEEIFAKKDDIRSADDILNIMKDPRCRLDNSSKISSYQENLTVKLTLTPKIIARLREWFPGTLLIGCKLLEDVPQEELFSVAQKLCEKNNMNYIMANDLAELRKGHMTRYLVDCDGYTGKNLDTPEDIFSVVEEEINKKS